MAPEHVREKTVQCRKATVTSGYSITTVAFEVLKKCGDEISVEIGQSQTINRGVPYL
jgi:hypothetical protein